MSPSAKRYSCVLNKIHGLLIFAQLKVFLRTLPVVFWYFMKIKD